MIDEQILNQALGMKIPGVDSDKIYQFLLKSKYSSNIQNSVEQILNIKKHENYFISEITQQQIKKDGNNIDNNNQENQLVYIEAIPLNKLNSTEKAFYQVYDQTKKILSDREAQIKNLAQIQKNQIEQQQQTSLAQKQQPVQQPQQQPIRAILTAFQKKQLEKQLQKNAAVNSPQQLLNNPNICYEKDQPQTVQRWDIDDENNKKYCICDKQPENFPIMVSCENKECPVEWYHSVCVGLGHMPQDQLEAMQFICSKCKDTFFLEDQDEEQMNQ